MKSVACMLAAVGASLGLGQWALGATTVTKTAGTGSISGLAITSDTLGQKVKFTTTGAGAMAVLIEVDTPTELDAIEIEVNKQAASTAQVYLTVRAKPGTMGKVQRVGTVRRVSADGVADGELIITGITTDADGLGGGNIGARGTERGGEISGAAIDTINCAGNMTANITAQGLADGTFADIHMLNLGAGKSLLGDVSAPHGLLRFVSAPGGDIGADPATTTAPQPRITVGEGITKIVARNCWGAIKTTGPIANIQRLDLSGNFAGTLNTYNIAVVEPSVSDRGFFVGGDLSGTMTFANGMIGTMTIGGALTGTIDTGSVASDRPAFDPERDTDVMIGSFPASGRFICRGNCGGPVTIAGPLEGTMIVGTVGRNTGLYNQFTAQGVTGTLTVHGFLVAGKNIALSQPVGETGRINIGGSLVGAINMPDNGLLGRVLLNSDFVPNGDWMGGVSIGALQIASPPDGEYEPLPSTFGGGTLAYVPFRIQKNGCLPAHNSPTPIYVNQFAADSDYAVQIRSYGPLMKGPGAETWADTVRVEREDPADSCNWVDVENLFTVSMPDEDDGRVLEIRGAGNGLPLPGKYRVVSERLLCRDVTGNPAVQWPLTCGTFVGNGAYVFRVAIDCDNDGQPDSGGLGGINMTPGGGITDENNNGIPDSCEDNGGGGGGGGDPPVCLCDTDHDTMITVGDLFFYLDLWFGDFGYSIPGLLSDIDHDGSTTVADLFTYLDCWFGAFGTTCP